MLINNIKFIVQSIEPNPNEVSDIDTFESLSIA